VRALDLVVRCLEPGLLRERRVLLRRLLRVQDGCVVELRERVHVQLPVGLDRRGVAESRGLAVERVALQRGHHRAEELAQRLFRGLGEVDEDEPGPHVAVHRHQTGAALVDAEELALLLDERERAVEVVTPAVVLAGELPADTLGVELRVLAPGELVAAVAAHVVEGADGALLVAQHEDGGVGGRHVLREVAAATRELLDPAHVQPGALEDGLALALVVLGRDRVLVRHGAGAELGIVLGPAPLGRFRETRHGRSPPVGQGGGAASSPVLFSTMARHV
jgi:hypothetical protein